MKKKILILLITLSATIYAFGQDSLATQPLVEFRGTTMVSVFGGGYTAQENSNNNGINNSSLAASPHIPQNIPALCAPSIDDFINLITAG